VVPLALPAVKLMPPPLLEAPVEAPAWSDKDVAVAAPAVMMSPLAWPPTKVTTPAVDKFKLVVAMAKVLLLCRLNAPAALLPILTVPVEVPVLMLVLLLDEAFNWMAPPLAVRPADRVDKPPLTVKVLLPVTVVAPLKDMAPALLTPKTVV